MSIDFSENIVIEDVPEYRTKTSALDVQIGGSHYKEFKIQPVEFVAVNNIGFIEGCVIKRMARHNKPTGNGVEDIDKAIHELQLLRQLKYEQV